MVCVHRSDRVGAADIRSGSLRVGVSSRHGQGVEEGCATAAAAHLHRPCLPTDDQVLEAGPRAQTHVPRVGGRLREDVESLLPVSHGTMRRHQEVTLY